MDWSSHYPAFVAEGDDEPKTKSEDLESALTGQPAGRVELLDRDMIWETQMLETGKGQEGDVAEWEEMAGRKREAADEKEAKIRSGAEAMDIDRLLNPEPAAAVKRETSDEPEAKPEVEVEMVRPKKLRRQVEVADIGCGFGGLLFSLSPVLPDTLILGTTSLYTA